MPVVDTSQLCSFTITDLVKNTEDKVEGLVNKWESMITLDRNFREISILLRTISQIGKKHKLEMNVAWKTLRFSE